MSKIKSNKLFLSIVFIVILSTLRQNLGVDFNKYPDNHWFGFPLNTTILNENDPIWLDRNLAYEIKDQSQEHVISTYQSGIEIISWTGSKREYKISSPEDNIVIEKTMYFPGWETTIDQEKIDLDNYKERKAGLINYDLPAGEHTIITRFTQNTPARIMGNTLSFIGLVLLIIYSKTHKK